MESTLPRDHEDPHRGGMVQLDKSLQFGAQVHADVPSDKCSGCEGSNGQGLGEARKVASMAIKQGKEQIRGHKKREKESPLCCIGMDICHLRTAELEPKYQKVQKGRVVLRGDIGEDDPGACAAFTEQGSSASQMTGAKAMDVVVILLDCAGQAADAASAHTQDGGRSKNCSIIPKSDCPDVWIRLPRLNLRKSLRTPPCWPLVGETARRSSIGTWNVCLFMGIQDCACGCTWMTPEKAGRKQNVALMWKTLMKFVDLGEPTSFLDHVYLGCTKREWKPNETIFDEGRKMFESRTSDGATEKLPGWETFDATTVAWSTDMQGHAKKCVER